MNATSNKGITVDTLGGLGNQLFQYALGRHLSMRVDSPLHFDTWWHTSENRPFQLDFLSDFFHEARPMSDHRTAEWRLRLATRAPNLLRLISPTTITERAQGYDPRVLEARPGARLIGYFQSWMYFGRIQSSLRSEILSLAPASSWVCDQITTIQDADRPIAVHVRRGDYSKSRQERFHGTLGIRYYQSALDALEPKRGTEIFVFSDAPEAGSLIKAVAPRATSVNVVQAPQGAAPLETLLLMAKFPTIICANSTFSWWAAFLGHSSEQSVVVPRQWFVKRKVDTSTRFPPAWIIR